ncbi:MAG: DUF4011 domain-containing protein [Bacteroidetes bacterium]|nr:MAG: DUF4011 domain-containing protein [Bacteroidota bacterium]
MRQILHTYKLRLTNLSQGNRSLRLGRLSRHRDIDLRDLGFVEENPAEALLERILAGRDVTLLSRLDPRFEPANVADRRLNQIYRTVEGLAEESGSYDLCLGYPFVEGTFVDGTIARCPLVLFPVRLVRKLGGRPRWRLEINPDEPVVFNRTFLLAYERFQQLRLPEALWESELPADRDWQQWLNTVYEAVKAAELDINFNPRLFDQKLEAFPDLRKADMEGFKRGVLTCRPYAVLGLFPQSDSALLQDYETLEARAADFDLEGLFDGVPPPPVAETYIREEDRFFVSEVDQSQEAALLKIKQGASLVVHGPPGTGKSQVIVNIVADALAHGKRVLVVSQKRAALDVVYKRLAGLGLDPFAVLVHDQRQDRASIFRQIRAQIEAIPVYEAQLRDLNFAQWDHTYKLRSRQADQYFRKFENLHQALTEPQPCGLTAHSLYLRHDPTAERLPLDEPARRLDEAGLEDLLRLLGRVLAYAEYLAPDHPWAIRKSFHAYGRTEQEALGLFLGQLPAELDALQARYQRLAEPLSSRLLDTDLNEARIAAFRALDAPFDQPQIREDLAALHQDKKRPAQTEKTLSRLRAATDALDQLHCLSDDYWTYFESLVRHQAAYERSHKHALRFISVPFLRARWFLGRVLKEQGRELNDYTFQLISQDVRAFQELHRLYVRHHQEAFYADFPLLGSQADKRGWLARKGAALEVLQQMRAITYFQKVKPRFRQGELDLKHWHQSRPYLEQLANFTRDLKQARLRWQQWLSPAQCEALEPGLRQQGVVHAYLGELYARFQQDFAGIRELDRLLVEARPVEREVLDIVRPGIEPAPAAREGLLYQIRHSILASWIDQAERTRPILTEVSTRNWEQEREQYASLLAEGQEKVAELIRYRLQEQLAGIIEYNRLNNPVTFRPILHQVSKQRRVWSVRKLVRETWQEGLSQLVPCWLCAPESAAAIFPMEPGFFDIVVFDEASQCFVERGIPVLLRGKQAVIAGDEQQLQPLNLYQVRHDDGEGEYVETEMALEVESLLDLAKVTFEQVYLRWHYRSQTEALIQFSNHAFYGGRLQMMPRPAPDPHYHPPLRWVPVAGTWLQNRNEAEADQVIALVREMAAWADPPSLGIVTFNYPQQELIKDRLDATLEALNARDPAGYAQLQAALTRRHGATFEGLFVKNIENVQGDERDVIIFSVGYAPDEQGKVAARFGLLNLAGGENRLNVAITRARHQVVLVCSLRPEQLPVDDSLHPGPRFFRDYLRFARAISEGQMVEARDLLPTVEGHRPSVAPAFNPLAERLAEDLRAAGYRVDLQLGETGGKLDLAVADPAAPDRYLLGIMCEGPYYFSGADSKEREVYRHRMLAARGWVVTRVWARNYWQDPAAERDRLLQLLDTAQSKS